MSILSNAAHVAIAGGNWVAAAPGSTVTVTQGNHAGGSSAFRDLSAATAHTALHDSAARFDAPRCHRNTRAKYRDGLELWTLRKGKEFKGKQLIWVHGGAGAGKSAIMQSVVEQCAQHGTILGSFFFSRADQSRNHAEVLIPTLAYQVAHAFPEAMVVLEPFIQRNPLIFKASLQTQALELLVRPLRYLIENGLMDSISALRTVFVIDGLDECSDPRKQALVIRVIASMLREHRLPVCFLIASRLEVAISSAFERETELHDMFSIITLDNDEDAQSDIRQFIEDSFLDIIYTHPLRHYIDLPWPDCRSIDRLVSKSSEHFIYAATAMKFITSPHEHPERALEVVEGLEQSRTGSLFAEIDALYTYILTSARNGRQVPEILRHCYLSPLSSTTKNLQETNSGLVQANKENCSTRDANSSGREVAATTPLADNVVSNPQPADNNVILRHRYLSPFSSTAKNFQETNSGLVKADKQNDSTSGDANSSNREVAASARLTDDVVSNPRPVDNNMYQRMEPGHEEVVDFNALGMRRRELSYATVDLDADPELDYGDELDDLPL